MGAKGAIFLLGFLCGCMVMNVILAAKLDALYSERETLLITLVEKEKSLERIAETFEHAGSPQIKEIKPVILLSGNRPLQIELEKRIREQFDIFLGRELSSLDPMSIPFIIDGRLEIVNDHQVLLKVETTIISEQLIIFITPYLENPTAD
jgi:hypothetical protein